MTTDRPPHFPDPDANAIALLEAAIAEKDEALADAHKEAKAWQAQLEAALERINGLEATIAGLRIGLHTANLMNNAIVEHCT